ncbi:hypothetical protein K439DRAFT_1631877 [Ramaria rubella]|nr:hypothetical protein K439DRAFT_1631877 [Ramaria rubella]
MSISTLTATTVPTLRKRASPMTSSTLTSLLADASLPESSQLPSPLSSIDEDMRTVTGEPGIPDNLSTRGFTRRRRSTAKSIRKARSASSLKDGTESDRADIPLAVALVPPLGSFLTGGDFLRDFLLFLLLFFYLHQLIKLPWELYLASRPRGKRARNPDASFEQERLHDLVESELRTAEFTYLTFSVLAPLLGASLLRYVGTALTGKDYISWFSTGVFVLVTGVRPWRHLGRRLRSRTEELQESIHAFRTEGEDMPKRLARLEEEIAQLKQEAATKDELLRLNKDIGNSMDVLDTAVSKHERLVELERRSMDERFIALEKAVAEALRNVNGKPQPWTLASTTSFFDWLHSQALSPPETTKSPTAARSTRITYRPRLAVVREEDDNTRIRATGKPRTVRRVKSQVERWLDLLVFPFSAGRTVLWGIWDFLHRALV